MAFEVLGTNRVWKTSWILIGVVSVSFTIWAAGGAALARFVDDERRRCIVRLVLVGLIVASIMLLWI